MAFDGLFLAKITKELKNHLDESRLEKIHQPEKDEIILTFKNRKKTTKVLMTSASDSARVHITEVNKQNPLQAPLFTMVLRKYLQSSKLISVEQINGDRILNFKFLASDEMGFDSEYILSCEMMGRHSNIILIRVRDMKILESIKHIGYDQNSYRQIQPGALYKSPPSQNKINPSLFSIDELEESLHSTEIDSNIFSQIFKGISKKTSKVLWELLLKKFDSERFLNEDTNYVAESMAKIIEEALNSDRSYVLYKDEKPTDISLLKPNDLDDSYKVLEFESPSSALENYISTKDSFNRVKEKSNDIIKILHNNIERVEKKISILEKTIEDSKEKDIVKLKGELIQANLYNIKEGSSEAFLVNYYDDNKLLKVELNPYKSLSYNMQNYFRRYNKLKRSEEMAKEQLLIANDELSYLNSVSDSVMRSEDSHDIDEIRQELIVAGYIRFKSNKKHKDSPSKPMKFKSSEGVTIYVGKNNLQNDYLTTKFSDSSDTWLHTKNYPGSHVIIKAKHINDETLLEAANLAAYYSKASNGTKVAVDYTLIKYVKKPNGSKPGMVIYTTNKTIYVDPETPRLERI